MADAATIEGAGSRAPVLQGSPSIGSVSDRIADMVLRRPTHWGWFVGFGVSLALTFVFVYAIGYLFANGVGVWGVNIPVAWAFALTNFVWWVGIGHAGTFISAVLLLLRQKWRTSINRFAEAMTLFAVSMAGLMPILHLGRPWFFYWLVPYPSVMNVWPQWRSPLVWDLFAISTYALVSLLFWYQGLIPDLATLRDRATVASSSEKGGRFKQVVYGFLALGWRNDARHWKRYESCYTLLAGLATPLVVSVHTIVSLDFATGIVPGWHSTIFPPYFVAGALFSGFAMVLTIGIPLRRVFALEDFITKKHLDNAAKILLACGLIVQYSYVTEVLMAFYSGDPNEIHTAINRFVGPYAWTYWLAVLCNVVVPQVLWLRRVRSSALALLLVSLVVNVGMWLERFMIIVTSLHRDFMPSTWGMYKPTIWDWAILVGSIGCFVMLFFLFVRLLPLISITEMRELAGEKRGELP